MKPLHYINGYTFTKSEEKKKLMYRDLEVIPFMISEPTTSPGSSLFHTDLFSL